MAYWTIDLTIADGVVSATVKNVDTGAERDYAGRIDDYRGFYEGMKPNPHGHSEEDLAEGQAVGELFADIRDTFDSVK